MLCFSCDLHGADDFVLRTGVAVQDLGDLIPAGLDGGADSIYFLQTSLVCWWRRHEVLLVGKPPEDRWQTVMIVLVSSVPLVVGFNLMRKCIVRSWRGLSYSPRQEVGPYSISRPEFK